MRYEDVVVEFTKMVFKNGSYYKQNYTWEYNETIYIDNIVSATINPSTVYSGYCETCYYEEPGFKFSFDFPDGTSHSFQVPDDYFGDMVKDIVEFSTTLK